LARVTVEDCLDHVDNRFALVLLVAKRAKQLLKGSTPTVPSKSNKYIVSALREVAAGSVHFDNVAVNQEMRNEQVEHDLNR
jgi:DNA-directed RNA polymerase subunit omega